MKKVIATCLMLLALTGCTYSLTLMSREDGETGYGTASNSGSQNGPISITLAGKTYTGTWATSRMDDRAAFMSAYARDNSGNKASASGFGQSFGSGSVGTALLRAADGSGLRCQFQFGGNAGFGVCRTDDGRLFDMQVSRGG